LRRRSVSAGTVLWRIDAQTPQDWDWTGFPEPRNRFDPASGRFRVRYAATTPAGAARERYLSSGRYIPFDHRDHWLVSLTARRPLRVLDLRTEANLDALALDDRVSTARDPEVWRACHRLADGAFSWWPDALDGIVYRSRTTPASSFNVAFRSAAAFAVTSRELGECPSELTDWVLNHRFTVGFEIV
jgi:hypothetical protein